MGEKFLGFCGLFSPGIALFFVVCGQKINLPSFLARKKYNFPGDMMVDLLVALRE